MNKHMAPGGIVAKQECADGYGDEILFNIINEQVCEALSISRRRPDTILVTIIAVNNRIKGEKEKRL